MGYASPATLEDLRERIADLREQRAGEGETIGAYCSSVRKKLFGEPAAPTATSGERSGDDAILAAADR